MKKVIVLIIGLFSTLTMQSQDIEDVFNDGGISNIKQQVGINAGEMINGYFTPDGFSKGADFNSG